MKKKNKNWKVKKMFQKFKSYKVTMHQVTTKTINQLKPVINKHKEGNQGRLTWIKEWHN